MSVYGAPGQRDVGFMDALQIAFVQGAKWWEQRSTGGAMWASDRNNAEAEALAMALTEPVSSA